MIERLELFRLRVPLVKPYRLSFGPVTAYDTLIVRLTDRDGRSGLGEATLLTGYTDETIDESWRAGRELAASLVRTSCAAYARAVEAAGGRAPFLATAFMTALDLAERAPELRIEAPRRVPLLALLDGADEAEMRAEADRLVAAGYGTFKVKVGFEPEKDLAHVARARAAVADRGQLRLDANQGYSAEQAIRFVRGLDPEGIELFEQPCAAGDWEAHLAVLPHARVPLMLDESIYEMGDIERAAELACAGYVKVKLMKFVSVARLADACERIRALGMRPVLGNGVANDLSCWMEACVAARHIDNAGEMNGFLKPVGRLLTQPLACEAGAIVLDPGFSPALDEAALARFGIDRFEAR